MAPVSSTFPHTRKSRLGYDVNEVEEFLEEARRAYTADRSDVVVVSADTIPPAAPVTTVTGARSGGALIASFRAAV